MQIDTEHLHYWMQAIRQSPDPMRTMDAFWSGQLKSKEWLIDNLRPYITTEVTIDIHGGWVGVLASMLFQSGLPIKHIRSVDIDHHVQDTANTMNKGEEIGGKFHALLANMCDIQSDYDVIINTSCEHISHPQYKIWLANIMPSTLLVLQSNNYQIDEHVRIANSLDEFKEQSNINIVWSGELVLPLYTRYMIIGRKL
jgi:hypothetical protein